MAKNCGDQPGFSAVEAVLVLVMVALFGVAGFLVYNHNKVAKTPVASTTSTKTTTTTTPATTPSPDPYAGWLSASAKYEKLSVKYPKTWKLDNTSTVNGATGTVSPGSDQITLTSPSGLQVTVRSGVTGLGGGPYYGKLLAVNPITTMGGSYYLGFGNNAPGDDTTATTSQGCVGTTATTAANFPYSKYITVSGSTDKPFNTVCIGYPNQSNGDTTQKTVAQFQADASFNDAKLVVQSLAY